MDDDDQPNKQATDQIYIPETGDRIEFKSTMGLWRCPCRQKFEIDETTGTIIHTMPACRKFIELDSAEYIKWAREHGAHLVN